MATAVKVSVVAFIARINAMVAGFLKVFTPSMTFTVNGAPMTQPQVVSRLQGFAATIQKADAAKAAWEAAVAAKEDARTSADLLLRDLEGMLKQTLGKANPQLPDFGIPLPKPRSKPDAETTAVAVGKRRDTRGVRGTKGKQQALAITTAGKPGVALVGADGKIVPGLLRGPTPPGSGTPVEVTGTVAPATSGAPAPAPAGGGTGSGTPSK